MFARKKVTIESLLASTNSINRLDAELLLAHVLHASREFLISRPETPLSWMQRRLFRSYVAERNNGTPLAYITGHKEFYGLDFIVTRATLIPRPETEHMVERAIELINVHNEGKILLIDIGTGSGCIPIAITSEIDDPSQVIKTIATDISGDALAVAKQNAKIHTRDIVFKHGNLLEPVIKDIQKHCCDIIITANLPYVPVEDYNAEPSIHAEPKQALVADDGGIALYRELIQMLPKEAESRTTLFLEIDPSQTTRIQQLVLKRHPQATVSVIKDLANRDRIIEVHL